MTNKGLYIYSVTELPVYSKRNFPIRAISNKSNFHEQYSGGLKRWQHTTHQTDDNQMILHTNLEIFLSPREYITVVLYFMTLHWCAYKMCNTPE